MAREKKDGGLKAVATGFKNEAAFAKNFRGGGFTLYGVTSAKNDERWRGYA